MSGKLAGSRYAVENGAEGNHRQLLAAGSGASELYGMSKFGTITVYYFGIRRNEVF